jgi:isocitrate dehydrogenase
MLRITTSHSAEAARNYFDVALKSSDYTVLEAQARAVMKSTNMAFEDAFAHVIAKIGGDWHKWKSDLGARDRESKSSTRLQRRAAEVFIVP